MKRKLIICLCAVITTASFIGCNKKSENNKVDNSNPKQSVLRVEKISSKSENEQKEILNKFDKLAAENSSEQEIIKFVDENIKDLSKENASTLVLNLESFKNKNFEQLWDNWTKNNIDEKIHKQFKYDFTIDKMQEIKDEELKKYFDQLINNGYKLIMTEGQYCPMQDYEFFKRYNEYVTDEIKDYLAIQTTESNTPAILDAGLNISWDELYMRAEQSEKFLNKYPKSKIIKSVKDLYDSYVSAYLFAMTFEPQSKKLYDEVRESYLKVDESDTNSRIAKTIKEYINILEKSDYKLTKEIDEFREKALDELKKFN